MTAAQLFVERNIGPIVVDDYEGNIVAIDEEEARIVFIKPVVSECEGKTFDNSLFKIDRTEYEDLFAKFVTSEYAEPLEDFIEMRIRVDVFNVRKVNEGRGLVKYCRNVLAATQPEED